MLSGETAKDSSARDRAMMARIILEAEASMTQPPPRRAAAARIKPTRRRNHCESIAHAAEDCPGSDCSAPKRNTARMLSSIGPKPVYTPSAVARSVQPHERLWGVNPFTRCSELRRGNGPNRRERPVAERHHSNRRRARPSRWNAADVRRHEFHAAAHRRRERGASSKEEEEAGS